MTPPRRSNRTSSPKDGRLQEALEESTSKLGPVRRGAVFHLAASENPRAFKAVVRLAKDRDPQVASRALDALAKRTDDKGIRALVSLTRPPNWDYTILAAIQKLGETRSPAMFKAFERIVLRPFQNAQRDPYIDEVLTVLRAQRAQTHPGAVTLLTRLAHSPNEKHRHDAIEALSDIHHPHAFKALAELSKQHGENEARHAFVALTESTPVASRVEHVLPFAMNLTPEPEGNFGPAAFTPNFIRRNAQNALDRHHEEFYGKPEHSDNPILKRLQWVLPHVLRGTRTGRIIENPMVLAKLLHQLFHSQPLRRLKTPKAAQLYLSQLRDAHGHEQLK